MRFPALRRSALSFGAMCLISSSTLALRTQSASAEQARLSQERHYQQELAKRRAEEAKARAGGGDAASVKKTSAEQFTRLITLAEEYESGGQGDLALRTYDRAMEVKPADLPEPENARLLRLKLVAYRQIVSLTVKSDNKTWVSIAQVGPPAQAETITYRLSPGEHVATGRRKGFRDVRVPFTIRVGEVPAPVTVICTERMN